MLRTWLLLAALLALVVACNPTPESEGAFEPGGTLTVTLPPSGSVYVTLKGASGPTRVYAQSPGALLRLVVLNQDQNPMLASAAHTWFGLPQVALAAAGAEPQIAVEPVSGPRLNLNAYPGYDYYLKLENHSGQRVEAELGAVPFEPRPDGEDAPLAPGETVGALEFVGEIDGYRVVEDGYLELWASGSGAAWIVADVYAARTTGSPKLATLEPGGPGYPVAAGNYVLVRARGNAAAGFDEPESFQYTLILSVAAP